MQTETVAQAFTTAFIHTFKALMYLSGYVLFGATLLSIFTPKEDIIRAMFDGSITQPLTFGFMAIVAVSFVSGLMRSLLAAFRARATLTLFRAVRYKF